MKTLLIVFLSLMFFALLSIVAIIIIVTLVNKISVIKFRKTLQSGDDVYVSICYPSFHDNGTVVNTFYHSAIVDIDGCSYEIDKQYIFPL